MNYRAVNTKPSGFFMNLALCSLLYSMYLSVVALLDDISLYLLKFT